MPDTQSDTPRADRPVKPALPPFGGPIGAPYPVLRPLTDLRGRQTLPPFFMQSLRRGGPLPGSVGQYRSPLGIDTSVAGQAGHETRAAWSDSSPSVVVELASPSQEAIPSSDPANFVSAEFDTNDFAAVEAPSNELALPDFAATYPDAGEQDVVADGGATTTDLEPSPTVVPDDVYVARSAWDSPVPPALYAPPATGATTELDDESDLCHSVDPEYAVAAPDEAPAPHHATSEPPDAFAALMQRPEARPVVSSPPSMLAVGAPDDAAHQAPSDPTQHANGAARATDDIADLFADPNLAPDLSAVARPGRTTPVLGSPHLSYRPTAGAYGGTPPRGTPRRVTPVLGSHAITPMSTPVIRRTPMAGTLAAIGSAAWPASDVLSTSLGTTMSPTPIAVPALPNMFGSRVVAQALEKVAARIRAGELIVTGDVPMGEDPTSLAGALAAALAALLGVRH